jgi:beta-N-acetylhexosaminidase
MPACFSRYWLKEVLRKQLDFQGLIFSDDLSMGAAALLGDIRFRTSMAIEAGCDLLLVCNDPASAEEALNTAEMTQAQGAQRVNFSMKTLMDMPIDILFDSPEYRESLMRIEAAVNGDLN